MAFLVISWKTIRFTGTRGFRTSTRCQEIDSPSRSSSVARYTASASFSLAFSFLTCSFFSLGTTYSGLKSLSVSTPRRAQGSFL